MLYSLLCKINFRLFLKKIETPIVLRCAACNSDDNCSPKHSGARYDTCIILLEHVSSVQSAALFHDTQQTQRNDVTCYNVHQPGAMDTKLAPLLACTARSAVNSSSSLMIGSFKRIYWLARTFWWIFISCASDLSSLNKFTVTLLFPTTGQRSPRSK